MEFYTNTILDELRLLQNDRNALYHGQNIYSIQIIYNKAIELAITMSTFGVRANDRIVLVIPIGFEFVAIIYACMMLNTVISIIDPEMGKENYLSKLNQFKPNFAFVDSRLLLLNEHPILKYFVNLFTPFLPNFIKPKDCIVFSIGPKLPILQKHFHLSKKLHCINEKIVFHKIDDHHPFLIIYTSGTLNEPKGVIHSYLSLKNSLALLGDLFKKHNNNKRVATHLPHFVLLGVNSDIEVFIWDNNASADQKFTFIIKNQISTLFGPPSDFLPIVNYCHEHGVKIPNCIKNIYLGSAPVSSSFLQLLFSVCQQDVRITSLYGMTENLLVSHIDGYEKINNDTNGDLVGYLFPDVKITFTEDGELGIDSNQLCTGYWQLPPLSSPFKTGDLGHIDMHGRLVLHGRKKEMIIRGNFNIYPGLYEPTISKINGINEAVMIGIFDKEKMDELIILVVENYIPLNSNDIYKQLKSGPHSIDRMALPDQIIFSKIPRSGRQQKIDRKKLAELIKAELS